MKGSFDFGLPKNPVPQAIPGLDMSKQLPAGGPRVGAIGVKGPWNLNPGNPNFPNHRPFLTNVKAPNTVAPVASQKLKFT